MARNFDKRLDSQRLFFDQLDHARKVVRAAAWIFGFFAIVHLQDYPMATFVEFLDAKTIISLTLTAYYYAWFLAQSIEMKMSQAVYIVGTRMPKSMFLQVPTTIITGWALFYFRDNEKHLAVAMLVFFLADVAAWRNVVRLTFRFEALSTKEYERERSYLRLAQLRYYVRTYLRGRWQYIRYGSLFCILVVVFVAAFFPFARQWAATQVAVFTQASSGKIYDLSFALLFLIYISVAEIIVWEMRLRTRRAILVLDDLRINYKVSLSALR